MSVQPLQSSSTNEQPSPLTIDDLGDLENELYSVVPKCIAFGLQLGIKDHRLQAIQKMSCDPYDQLREILRYRLKQVPLLTWFDIVQALQSNAVQENQLASYIQSRLVPTHHPQPYSSYEQIRVDTQLTVPPSANAHLTHSDTQSSQQKLTCSPQHDLQPTASEVNNSHQLLPPVCSTYSTPDLSPFLGQPLLIGTSPLQPEAVDLAALLASIYPPPVTPFSFIQTTDALPLNQSLQHLPSPQQAVSTPSGRHVPGQHPVIVCPMYVHRQQTVQEQPALNQTRVCDSDTDCSPPQAKRICHNSPLAQFIKYIRIFYQQNVVEKDLKVLKWPPTPTTVYINLVSVDLATKVSKSDADECTRAMVEDGNVDVVLAKKRPIEFSDIATQGSEGKIILVEGAPGVGKSTFAMEFCRRWDRDEIAKQYQLVLLLRLRDHRMSKAENLGDLLYHPDTDIHRDVTKELVSTLGANTLIILDGYDELPGACRSESSVFLKLICGQLLPLATMLITSRPWAAHDLHKNCRHRIFQHIEILGFGGKEIDEYVTSVLTDKGRSADDSAHEEIMLYIRTYPQIRACMYIPVNAAIVVKVYMESKAGNCILPKTLTQLYYALIQTLLLRYLYGHAEYGEKKWNISSLKDLPQEVYSQILILSQLAYTGICTDKEDSVYLIYSNLPPDFETLGLMQSVPQLYVTQGESVSHNFLHLTVQEFLAALHISNMSPEQQLDHLQRQKEGRMRVVLRFLAGLTKLDSIPPEALRSLLLDEPGHSFELYKPTLMADVRISVEHVNWMFETQSGDIFFLVFQEKTVQFNIHRQLLLDYYSLGYCFAHSHSKWVLFFDCNIEEEEIEMLVSGTKMARNIGGRVVMLWGKDNNKSQLISAEALNVLFTGLENMINLQELHLPLPVECCRIAWPNLSGLQVLTLRIWGNRNWELDSLLPPLSLQSLTVCITTHAYGDGHGLELEDCRAIGNFLSSSKCLRCFELHTWVVHNEGVEAITVGMSVNESLPLTRLVMGCVCTFSDIAAHSLAMFITKSTTLMDVCIGYCTFSAHELLELAQAVHHNTSIQERELEELECTVDGDDNAKDFFQLLAGHSQWKEWMKESSSIKFTHFSENGVETVARFLHEDNALRDLNLSDNSIKDDGVTTLSLALHHNSYLECLSLYNDSISDSGAAALANALHHNSTLWFLDLSNNCISDSGAAAFAHALCHNSTLGHLDLSNNSISDSGTADLAHALHYNSTLWTLNLSNNQMSDSGNSVKESGVAALAHALHHNSCLSHLNLTNNSASDIGAASLAQALLHNSKLDTLNLSSNSISDIGAASLAQGLLHNSKLHTLNLSSNNISDGGAANLGQALHHNSTLWQLNLSNNGISYSGAADIARALHHNSNLCTLKLSNNNVGDSGADALAQALHHNSTLTELDLSNNSISESAGAFLHHLNNSHILYLYLSNNSLNDNGIAAIAQGILVKNNLNVLNLSNNGISDHGATALAQALHHIRSLERLDLRDNDDIGEEGTHQIIQALSVSEAIYPVLRIRHGKPDTCGLILPRKCEQYATQCPQYSDVKNRIGFR